MKGLLACAIILLSSLSFARAEAASPDSPSRWTQRSIEMFGSLPVQEGGRVKPISTYADFTLLRLSGRKSLTRSEGVKVSSSEWLLDQIFFPEESAGDPMFLVADDIAIEAIGLPHESKKKRDRYSFRELEPGVSTLLSLGQKYSSIDEKRRSSLQRQVVDLAEAVQIYLSIAGQLGIAIVPPESAAATDPAWHSPEEIAEKAHGASESLPIAHREILDALRGMVEQRENREAFEKHLEALGTRIVSLAENRDEYWRVPLERSYYRADFLFWGQILFLLAFLGAATLWLFPQAKLPYRFTATFASLGTLALVAAIVLRCLIRGRPPVSTLYETVLFITAVGAMVALIAEKISRQRIALSAAAVLGVVGVFIANGYETLDKRDTMPSLVAVLDTNFWLSTHVTSITIGYAAGMLAAVIASFYLLAKAFGFKRADRPFYATISRMVYGVLCFGVIFSTVGTILGGIWANDSWGRFWGWDPKENGALLIVISQLAILHGRMGGFLKEHGICAAAAFGGTIVAFSWFGVNLLGVGLHSYGFTSGIHTALWTYYLVQWAIVGLGAIAWIRDLKTAST